MIRFENVTKKYGKTVALDSLNFIIPENELFAFVGPNGAGKSTAIRILSGILLPTGGRCLINGIDSQKDTSKIKGLVGYVPDLFGVYDNLNVMEYMRFFASAYGIVGNDVDKLCYSLLDMVQIGQYTNSYIEDLSRGVRHRLCVARALIHDPKILVLDEPVSGLDPKSRVDFKEFLKMLNINGKTIVISTHILQEATELCTGMAVMEGGKLVISGSIKEIEQEMNSVNPIVMKVSRGSEFAVKVLKNSPCVKNLIISEEDEFYIHFEGNLEEEAKLLQEVVSAGTLVSSFSRKGHSMESVFLKIMG